MSVFCVSLRIFAYKTRLDAWCTWVHVKLESLGPVWNWFFGEAWWFCGCLGAVALCGAVL